MELETLYKKFNFPASSTFLKLLKNEGLKYTKDEVDKFIKGRTEQQQTTIKTEKKKDLGKIVSFYPLSLVQMDIYDLAKYYRENQGYKYILCFADVYSRKVWAYKMKNKDNDNVFDAFKQFIKDSDLKKYKPTTLMSDHDSTFTNSKFKEILKENEIFQTLNIKDDHHALGLIDSFARTLKKTFTRIFLNNGNSNWIKHLDEVIDNFNSMPNTAINNIKPDNAFQEKNHRVIYETCTLIARVGMWGEVAAQGSRTPFASPNGEQQGGFGVDPPPPVLARRVGCPRLRGLGRRRPRGACRVTWCG